MPAASLSWRGLTPKQYKMRLREMKRDMRKIVNPPANESAKILRKELRRDIKSSREGRSLFPRKLGKLRMKTISARFSNTERAYIAGARLNGFGAWIAGKGGRTSVHRIRPVRASALFFFSPRAGRFIRTQEVIHPGGRVRGYNYAEKRTRGLRKHYIAGVSRAIVRFYQKVVAR